MQNNRNFIADKKKMWVEYKKQEIYLEWPKGGSGFMQALGLLNVLCRIIFSGILQG